MAVKNVHEIFEEYEKAENDHDRVCVLKYNETYGLKSVLRGAFHPGIQYVITEIPPYSKLVTPIGMGYNSINQEIDRAYLFEANNPRVADGLTLDRKMVILAQILEGLEPKEAEIYAGMLLKKLPVKNLTKEIVLEAYPDLLN